VRLASSDGPGQAVQVLPLNAMAGHLIRRAQQAHTALWSAEFSGDLTGPQYGLLSVLSTSQGGIDQSSAGRLAALDKSTAADVIARLQRNGWLGRHRGIPDGRQNLLVLTPAGRSALRDITPRVTGIQRRLLEPLAPGDQQWFTNALAQIAYEGQISAGP
jgi:DNA-binding MarR family transcriptional regulator